MNTTTINDIEIRKACIADRSELLQVIDRAFSTDERDCDFLSMLPHLFRDARIADHFVAIIDGKIAETSNWIKAGQTIELIAPDTNPKKVFQLQLEVLFEDDYFDAVNKPAGFPTNGNYYKTIENALPYNLKTSSKKGC